MLSLVLLGVSSLVSGAVLDRRDPVPAGYFSPPYYPCKSLIEQLELPEIIVLNANRFFSSTRRMGTRMERKLPKSFSTCLKHDAC
jgi:hypothetical protein